MTAEARILDTAISWHLRQADMAADAWTMFIEWLEADPRHARAFDAVAAADRSMPLPAGGTPVAANDDEPQRRFRPWALGGGLAAAAIAVLLLPMVLPRPTSPYAVETAPGERRMVALGDGTSIEMSGGTRLWFDRRDPRVATLTRGEAVFAVRHDPAVPFTVRAGGTVVRDLGTVFDVARTGARVDVQVAEGAVTAGPEGDGVRLTPGRTLTVREDAGTAIEGRIAADDVGSWRKGRLGFTGATLGEVFATIDRLYGTRVTLTGGLPARPFTGMVDLTGRATRDIPHVATLIGVEWRRSGDDWILAPPEAARP